MESETENIDANLPSEYGNETSNMYNKKYLVEARDDFLNVISRAYFDTIQECEEWTQREDIVATAVFLRSFPIYIKEYTAKNKEGKRPKSMTKRDDDILTRRMDYLLKRLGFDDEPGPIISFDSASIAGQELYAAWKERDLLKVSELIDKYSCIDIVNSRGETILHQAAWYDDIKFVKMLIEKGANINAVNTNGFTPLHHACINHHFNVVEYLIKNNADISIVSTNGWSIWKCLTDDPTFDMTSEKNTLLTRKKSMGSQ